MDVILIMLGILCLVLIYTVISVIHNDYITKQKLKNIPQIQSYPLIGDAIKLLRMNEQERADWYVFLGNYFKNGIFLQYIGTKPLVHIYKPELLEIIFPSTVNIEKGTPYELLTPWLGNGLLTSTVKRLIAANGSPNAPQYTRAQWFHDRKLIGPTFHFSILDQFAIVLSEKAEILVNCLEKEMEKYPGKAIDIFPFAINVALDIICETAMGVNIRAQEVESKYSTTVHRTSRLTLERLFQPWYWTDWIYYLMPSGREYKSKLNILHGFTREVIRKKKIARQRKNDSTEVETEADDIGKRKRKAFLDLLLDQNEKDDAPLVEDELRAQVDTFMFEGHDTTAVAITWTLFCLGNNLEHQEKVHEEMEQVFQGSQAPASVQELSRLKYLDRVIKETLRIYPSVPVISRNLAEDVTMNDYTIPKGTTLVMSILLTHYNSQVWPDPLKFDPDRFLPENSRNRNPYAYVPFSAGPRNCIGQRFALLEEKIVLTAILRKWKVKSVKAHVSYGGSLILRPYEEIRIHFAPKK